MIYLILDVKTTYLCFYCGQMNLCYSLIKTLQTYVLLELIGLIEKLGFQAPESYKRKQNESDLCLSKFGVRVKSLADNS